MIEIIEGIALVTVYMMGLVGMIAVWVFVIYLLTILIQEVIKYFKSK